MAEKTEAEYVEIDERVCENAANFSDLFYQAMDQRRSMVQNMYTEAACFVWNGHSLSGRANIHNFLTELPETSHHITAVDCQNVDAKHTDGQQSLVVLCAGTVQLGRTDEGDDPSGSDRRPDRRGFTQTFMLVKDQTNKYKIAMDRFRYAD